jgi:kanamycin kinase
MAAGPGPAVTEPAWPGVPVPPAVAAVVAGRPARVVWQNRLGGLTCEVGTGPDRCFVKWAPAGSGIDLPAEAARLAWALPHTPVPQPLGRGGGPAGTWLVTAALSGENAVIPRWLADPRTAVRAIGEGLRAMHDSLPVAACPFSWGVADRLGGIRRELGEGHPDSARWPSAGPPLSTARALELLADPPPPDQLVVCHGDSCAPNTLLDGGGCWCGHVDLGALGVADRWADLAIATWNVELNYGAGWQRWLLDCYGVAPDPARISYYRLLGRCP